MIRSTVALGVFLACTAVAFAEEDTFTLRGKVTSVSKADKNGAVTVGIKTPTGETSEHALVIKLTTKVEKASGKKRTAAKSAEIKIGQQVEAVCGKIVQPSAIPIVPTVKSILILEEVK
jgi:hypothetical protein